MKHLDFLESRGTDLLLKIKKSGEYLKCLTISILWQQGDNTFDQKKKRKLGNAKTEEGI